jgi:hypothetical protein
MVRLDKRSPAKTSFCVELHNTTRVDRFIIPISAQVVNDSSTCSSQSMRVASTIYYPLETESRRVDEGRAHLNGRLIHIEQRADIESLTKAWQPGKQHSRQPQKT